MELYEMLKKTMSPTFKLKDLQPPPEMLIVVQSACVKMRISFWPVATVSENLFTTDRAFHNT